MGQGQGVLPRRVVAALQPKRVGLGRDRLRARVSE